ncbi:MAG: 2-C-methyl-D-erythritol 2,4-cyclodiphosphate synthase [Candidatus Omnitrophica bacterium]|nr:2-C-methyl-D-erythritol 2,4-cyclodiphosphate synthase [Candidatus Omnitrophota bacterium]MCM8798766.1 2-C-methyl-D-erythritol 2,4-cyclodiphosphate synthase [Candidatus Omnitrophota bacterium]
MRVGLGYDIHRLVKGRRLYLGGIEIPFNKGLLGHSDGDVVLHAVSDALLGAIGGGDIGEYFPNTASEYRGMRSEEILARVFRMVKEKNLYVENLDITLIAEEPKISPYKEKVKENISRILKISIDNINLKATTNEGVGLIGKAQAIACFAVVSLKGVRD